MLGPERPWYRSLVCDPMRYVSSLMAEEGHDHTDHPLGDRDAVSDSLSRLYISDPTHSQP
jgi:hypothetical protein